MRFPAQTLFKAFKACGFTETATYRPGTAFERDVPVQWLRPDMPLLGGEVQATEHQIEYETAELPAIAEGDQLFIHGRRFRVAYPPQKTGDGTFGRAYLEQIGP